MISSGSAKPQRTKAPVTDPAALQQVVTRATEVIGSADEALRWLGTPVRDLDYATPISMLAAPNGKNRVLVVLDRLEHGVL